MSKRIRLCKACGEETTGGLWCNGICYRAENPGEDIEPQEDEDDD